MNKKWYVGQRILICRTAEGVEGKPVRAVITDMDRDAANRGEDFIFDVCLLDSSMVTTAEGDKVYPPGAPAMCWLSQVEPYIPEGAQPADWSDCLWNPSMLNKENDR